VSAEQAALAIFWFVVDSLDVPVHFASPSLYIMNVTSLPQISQNTVVAVSCQLDIISLLNESDNTP
jgi:hypothetical protein